ncbi:hypothetical protein COLO4_13214 [Corchorus olitorius]|uniref:Uncharacterized protein n=1 Tax=Corchorus olitorius TaxID=93759 RepID=A0A1R3JXQ1_9ROSI|nr:hypothetical protein COLO4_13214 [Corchorus olitorius]
MASNRAGFSSSTLYNLATIDSHLQCVVAKKMRESFVSVFGREMLSRRWCLEGVGRVVKSVKEMERDVPLLKSERLEIRGSQFTEPVEIGLGENCGGLDELARRNLFRQHLNFKAIHISFPRAWPQFMIKRMLSRA